MNAEWRLTMGDFSALMHEKHVTWSDLHIEHIKANKNVNQWFTFYPSIFLFSLV